jgi:hypothetical protein
VACRSSEVRARSCRIVVRGSAWRRLPEHRQRDAGVQGCGDECLAEGARPYGLGDADPAGGAPDDPPSAVAVQPPAIRRQEDRSFAAFADGEVNRAGGAGCQRDGDDLAALARDHQGTVAALSAEGLDVRAGRLRYLQAVQGQQRDQRVLGCRAEPGSDEQGARLVAVQPGGVRLVIQAGPADMGGRGVIQQFFLDGIPVEPGDRAQPAGDRGPGPSPSLDVTREALDVGAAGIE